MQEKQVMSQCVGPKIVLTPMGPGRDEEFAQMLEEFRAAGEMDIYRGHHAVAWQGYAAFYKLLSQMKVGGYPTSDIVPMNSYFIEAEEHILGEIYIRHRLSPRLEQVGGHIGYKVRPSCRNRGVATAALRLALKKLNQMGVERALVTCNANNAASARVIEKCGGLRIADAATPNGFERRYWVPTV
jgi:predicted acetyltransferase